MYNFLFFRLLHDLFDSDGANVSAKKRKSDKPKKHLGSTVETIVPKKPKNLFMNCLQQIQSTAGSATTTTTSTVTTSGSSAPGAKRPLPPVVAPSPADEYEFNEDDDFQLPTLGKHRYEIAWICQSFCALFWRIQCRYLRTQLSSVEFVASVFSEFFILMADF